MRVVLVDCDGRQRALSKLFPYSTKAGLAQLLRGGASLEDALMVDWPSGAYVVRHSATDDVAMLADTAETKDLIAKLLAHFDLVLLDTGPVLKLAESKVIAGTADAVLLVARWRKTPINATRLSLNLLSRAGAKVGAVALTMVKFA